VGPPNPPWATSPPWRGGQGLATNISQAPTAVAVKNGTSGFSEDGGPETSDQVSPEGIALDPAGTLYIADYGNHRIRKVSAGGVITTIAGTAATSTPVM
jgi:hypothetical protein